MFFSFFSFRFSVLLLSCQHSRGPVEIIVVRNYRVPSSTAQPLSRLFSRVFSQRHREPRITKEGEKKFARMTFHSAFAKSDEARNFAINQQRASLNRNLSFDEQNVMKFRRLRFRMIRRRNLCLYYFVSLDSIIEFLVTESRKKYLARKKNTSLSIFVRALVEIQASLHFLSFSSSSEKMRIVSEEMKKKKKVCLIIRRIRAESFSKLLCERRRVQTSR